MRESDKFKHSFLCNTENWKTRAAKRGSARIARTRAARRLSADG